VRVGEQCRGQRAAAGRRAERHDARGVAAKSARVGAQPFERQTLVAQAGVGRGVADGGRVGEAEDVKAVAIDS
jgi:hypothetical protein